MVENPYARKPKAVVSPSPAEFQGRVIENLYLKRPKAVEPDCSSSSSSLRFNCTQDAMHSVQEEISSYRNSTSSSYRPIMESIGAGVRELKQEVFHLRGLLEQARRTEMYLRQKLYYFEQREEDELIALSQDHDRSAEMFNREKKMLLMQMQTFHPILISNLNRIRIYFM